MCTVLVMTVYNKNRILVYNDVLCGSSLNFKLSLLDEIKNRQLLIWVKTTLGELAVDQNNLGRTGDGAK